MPRRIAAGNWKMNGLRDSVGMIDALAQQHAGSGVDILICPPATILAACANDSILTGGQDCHSAVSGAHTGDLSAEMLRDAGASHVIVGHSERRTDHGETNDTVAAKAQAAHGAGLVAVICIGETLAERESGVTLDVIDSQLAGSVPAGSTAANTVIAYEPVWAIGTGKVPTTAQIDEVHNHIRAWLEKRQPDGAEVSLLYGGSVKAANAAEIFGIAHVNGALVGGASLTVADFSPIISALEASA